MSLEKIKQPVFVITIAVILIAVIILTTHFYRNREQDVTIPADVDKPQIVYSHDQKIQNLFEFASINKDYTLLEKKYNMQFSIPKNWEETGSVDFYKNTASPFGYRSDYGFPLGAEYSYSGVSLYIVLDTEIKDFDTKIDIGDKEVYASQSFSRLEGYSYIMPYTSYKWKANAIPNGYVSLLCSSGTENDKENLEKVCEKFIETFEIQN